MKLTEYRVIGCRDITRVALGYVWHWRLSSTCE